MLQVHAVSPATVAGQLADRLAVAPRRRRAAASGTARVSRRISQITRRMHGEVQQSATYSQARLQALRDPTNSDDRVTSADSAFDSQDLRLPALSASARKAARPGGEDGRRAATRLGRHRRHLRPRESRHCRRGAGQRGALISRPGRRPRRQAAQVRPRQGASRYGRLTEMSQRSGEILPCRDRRRHQRADHRIEAARR